MIDVNTYTLGLSAAPGREHGLRGLVPAGHGRAPRQLPGVVRVGRARRRGGERGGMLQRGVKECAGYLSTLRSGSSEGVCHPGSMKNG